MSDDIPTRVLAVGQLYNSERTRYDDGSVQLIIDRYAIEIALFLSPISPADITSWCQDGVQFGWTDAGDAALLTVKPGQSWPWTDMSFHAQHVPAERRGVPGLIHKSAEEVAAIEEQGQKLVEKWRTELPAGSRGLVVNTAGRPEGMTDSRAGHWTVGMILANARNGKIVALHSTTWPPRFCHAVRATVERQMLEEFHPEEELARLRGLQATYSPRQLHKDRTQTKCVGGEPE